MTFKTYKHCVLRCLNCPNMMIVCSSEAISWLQQYKGQKIDYFMCRLTNKKIETDYLDGISPDCTLEDWEE